jgi:hypothetical protein
LLERALFQHGRILPVGCASQRALECALGQNLRAFKERE